MINLSRLEEFRNILDRSRYLLVVDLEATCNNDGSFPRDQMETIEFGGVVLDRDQNWAERWSLQFFIKPVLHTVLTPFCTKLTTITQSQVDDNGISYVQALDYMNGVTSIMEADGGCSWCSWGAYDRNQLVQDGKLHGLSPLLSPKNHFNMKEWYSLLRGEPKGYGLSKAVAKEELRFQGTAHRALDDARNVVEIFKLFV